MHSSYFITRCITALLNGFPTQDLPPPQHRSVLSAYSPFYIHDPLICALSWLITIHNLLSIYNLYSTLNPYITDLPNGLPTLNFPSTLPSFCMDGLLFYIISILCKQLIINYSLHHSFAKRTSYITFALNITFVLHGRPTFFYIMFILYAQPIHNYSALLPS